ncbi:peptidase C12, ubiquitin carboxyl-terminal hydrolase 1 [Athelia psychrophila]|uniref:Ubiquitin carboxyl-terminal hydrolase n=1 Tax=Athelia psychrophila TaxID=1759441 RepID=A0A166JN04_9AGAM|nr:peptidase C12, ubiquitin carboxyl-terminal hydrolase 1 [Fibularhizoctonia sp. CBS 109695]
MSRWIPLESNPEVLNSWANAAGLVESQTQFEDVYGLDPELLQMVSQPAKAVILLFPISEGLEAKRKEEEAKITAGDHTPVDPTVIWIKQTIPNACGTIGLLHALLNSDVTFVPNSPLAQFTEECKGKTPEERAKILETTPLFADIHARAASSGQTSVPENLDTNLHFTCFVLAPDAEARSTGLGSAAGASMRLIELDGRRSGPTDRGPCTDLLTDVAKIVKEVYVSQSSSMQFSMMSLGPPP